MFENEVAQTDGDMCGWMDGWVGECLCVYLYMCIDERMDGWMTSHGLSMEESNHP